MASFASLTLPDQATKMRFKEPFVSEAQNLKDCGIIPPGIFRGFVPAPQAGFLLNLNLDPARNDSVAAVETIAGYNLSVRAVAPITLDMTGQVIFPVYVVVRTEYQISPSPLSGLTTSKVMVVQTSVDNGDPQKLHDDDVKLCKVLGFVGTTPSISTAIPADRMDNRGPLLTQRVLGPLTVLNQPVGSLSTQSPVAVPLPSSGFSFTLNAPGVVAIDVCMFSEVLNNNADDTQTAIFSLQDTVSLVITDIWKDTAGVNTFGTPASAAVVGFPGIKRALLSLPAGVHNYQLMVRTPGPVGGSGISINYPLSVVVTLVG